MKQEARAVGESRIVFLGSVRGLVREAAEVAAAVEPLAPTCIVLSLGSRELDEVQQVLKERGEMPGTEGNRPAGAAAKHGPSGMPLDSAGDDAGGEESDYTDFGLFLSTSDLVFSRHLSRWGDVEAPPPSFQEAARLGHKQGLEVVAGDFDDEEYTDVFLKAVTAFSLIRQGRRLRKLTKKRFKANTPEEFALEWDAAVTRIRGYGQVEQAREVKVGQSIAAAARRHPRVLAVVELERLAGVIGAFDVATAASPQPAGVAP